MKIKGLEVLAFLASLGLVAAPMTASAALTEYECVDTAGDSGAGGHNVSSSISADTSIGLTDCGPHDGNDSETAVAGLYGEDWSFLDKWEEENGSSEEGTITEYTGRGGTSGSFSFDDVGSSLYLIVLKFDGVFSAFLSDMAADNWGWDTDSDGDGKFASSHISLYGADGDTPPGGGDTPVPTPLPLALIGIGLVGLFAAGRRRR